MEKEKLPLLIECKDCKKNFQAEKFVKHKKEFIVKEQSIFLTYYDCPHCNKRSFVQIDDKKSLQKLTKITREFCRLAINKRQGKEILKKQSDEFKKARQHLSDYRINLMKKFTGETVTDEDGKVYVLRFNV